MEAGGRPGWMRALAIVLGIIAIIIGILALVFPDFGFALLIILFSIGLLIVGLFAIAAGMRSDLPSWARALSLVIGVLVIILVLVFIFVPDLALFLQVLILGIGLLLLGIRAIAFEGTDPSLAGWARGLAIALGILAVILAILMIALPDVGETVLLIYFAVGLFATGIGAVVAGAAG